MRLEFVDRAEVQLLAEAALHFEAGPLAGTKLVGFALWRGADDSVGSAQVTFPRREVHGGGRPSFIPVLRPQRCDAGPELALKAWLREEYQRHRTGLSTSWQGSDPTLRLGFLPPYRDPDLCVAEAELQFAGGPLAGLMLTGIRLWRDREAHADVIRDVGLPSRALAAPTGEMVYLDFLRSADRETTLRVKAWIRSEYYARGHEPTPGMAGLSAPPRPGIER